MTRMFKARLLCAATALAASGVAQADNIDVLVANANAQLAATGENYRIEMAETITNGESDEAGRVIFFSNRGNKQLSFDFVPGDPRRIARGWGAGTSITFAVDNVNQTSDIGGTGELNEIRAAMATWQNQSCSTIPLIDRGNTNADVGVVQRLAGFFGTGGIAADIQHAGFLPGNFFIGVLGSANILGVTFTFRFVDVNGNSTDIDNNGKGDTAFREIYYNDGFTWEIDPNDVPGDGRFDIQTVALHEAGHGLSQGHFGDAFRSNAPGNTRTQWAPLAVMNAGYAVGQQQLAGTDTGGHCSNWGSWPRN